jgi:hydrogenase expression/formation protein HypD
VENAYARAVHGDGNPTARNILGDVFRVVPRAWRGIGGIPRSGLGLSEAYSAVDAARRFPVDHIRTEENKACLSGEILLGVRKPTQCPAFGAACTPEHPLGATMVSSEGACAAYYRYRSTAAAGAEAAS